MRGMVEMAAYLKLEAENERLRERLAELEPGAEPASLTVGRITIDHACGVASVDGEPCHLTGKEWAMLCALAKRPGALRSKEQLMDAMYGALDDEPDVKIIDVFVCKLRRKLGSAGDQIETLWGRGYRLADRATPQISHSPGLCIDVLGAIAESQKTFMELRRATDAAPTAARGAICSLLSRGLVRNIGHLRAALYEITPKGAAHLATQRARLAA